MKAVFIDIETTGLDFNRHEPLEVAVACVDLLTNDRLFTYSACIRCCANDTWIRADKEALKVNGFTQEKSIKEGKDAYEVMCNIEDLFAEHRIFKNEAFLICQNPSFDRPFFEKIVPSDHMRNLNFPYHWLDLASMYWIKFHGSCYPTPSKITLSKDSIARSFGLPPEESPHRALNGVEHLIKCYYAVSHNMVCNPTSNVI